MYKIVVVEDDVAISEMYKLKLTSVGYSVETALNGADGFTLIKKSQPDLILLDLRMPVMSGDVMLEKLRRTDWGSSVRVIVLTNISKSEAPPKLRFLSVDRYVVKAHHTPSELVSIVQEILR